MIKGRAEFQRVDRNMKLREVLEGQVVFEYPTFYIVLQD